MDNTVQCDLCGKQHPRENVKDYVHYRGQTFCTSHDGVMEWYNGALKIESLRFDLQSERLISDLQNSSVACPGTVIKEAEVA